jgi:hypothetical protein
VNAALDQFRKAPLRHLRLFFGIAAIAYVLRWVSDDVLHLNANQGALFIFGLAMVVVFVKWLSILWTKRRERRRGVSLR